MSDRLAGARLIADVDSLKAAIARSSHLVNEVQAASQRGASPDESDLLELDLVMEALGRLPVVGADKKEVPFLDVVRSTLTEERLSALDGESSISSIWSSPGWEELGRLRISKGQKGSGQATVAELFPVLKGGEQRSSSQPRATPQPTAVGVNWNMVGGRHWTWLWVGIRYYAYTRTWMYDGSQRPFTIYYMNVDLADSCLQTVSFRLRKIRHYVSFLDLSKTLWGGGFLAVGSNHRACLGEPWYLDMCERAGCMAYAPPSAFQYV